MATAIERQTGGAHAPDEGILSALDARLDMFVLHGRDGGGTLDVAASITSAELELTIEGASALTVELEDPHGRLRRSDLLTRWAWGEDVGDEHAWVRKSRAVDVRLGAYWFRLVKVAKAGTTVTLTFEDREVTYLRRHKGARKASRGKVTRAQFVRTLVREVKAGGGVDFYCPEVNVRQPIKRASDKVTEAERNRDALPGLDRGASLKVKGEDAAPGQLRNLERILDVCETHDAPPRATLAAMVAPIGEAGASNGAENPKTKAKGLFQLLPSTQRDFGLDPSDIEACAEQFLVHGFTRGKTGGVGAIPVARQHPDWTVGQIVSEVEGSDQGGAFYEKYLTEARAIVAAYGGGVGGRATTYTQRFEFARGKDETSWDAIQRLANDVGWRAFMRLGRLWFISEVDLFRAKPQLLLREGGGGVDSIDFDLDYFARNPVSEVRVVARSDRWTVRPGQVVTVEGEGIADGRWLVVSIRRNLTDASGACDVVLRKPIPELPEPASDTATKRQDDTLDGGGKDGKWKLGPGANRPGVGLTRELKKFLDRMATFYDGTLVVTTGTNHNRSTTSGNVSDHWSGNGADFGMVLNGGTDDGPVGDRIAFAAFRAAGLSDNAANAKARTGGANTVTHNGLRVQVIWKSDVGGNHHNHVHVGIGKA